LLIFSKLKSLFTDHAIHQPIQYDTIPGQDQSLSKLKALTSSSKAVITPCTQRWRQGMQKITQQPFRWARQLFACGLFITALSCSTKDSGSSVMDPVEAASSSVNLRQKAGTPSIDDMIAAAEPRVESESDAQAAEPVGDEITNSTTRDMPLEINASVEQWIQYFTVKDRERFQRFLERGEKYKPMITAVLKDQGIPTELYYQALIESGFTVQATSHAQAVGIWQFIRGTGKRYGLRTDSYVDERRDPMRATIAAALYMQDLYNVFQSWYLALGAYNAGEGRILGAIMRGKSRDFWELVRRKELPAETMNYIPKFLAATIVAHNLKKYGFEDLNAEVMPPLASVAVAAPARLSDISRLTGVSLATLREYNPHILRGITPPGDTQYRIWVPKDVAKEVESQKEAIASVRLHGLKSPVARAKSSSDSKRYTSDGRMRYHKVRRGESLALIAQRYGITIAQLKSLNKMRSSKIYYGTTLKVGSEKYSRSRKTSQKTSAVSHYRVRSGDNLNSIARRFGISVMQLKELNKIRRSRIYAGQVLKVQDHKG
jgi:membrane-bound lytic murein transglycosylase D